MARSILVILLILTLNGCLYSNSAKKDPIEEPLTSNSSIIINLYGEDTPQIRTGPIDKGIIISLDESFLSKYGIGHKLNQGNIFVLRGGFDSWSAHGNDWRKLSDEDLILTEGENCLKIETDRIISRALLTGHPFPDWEGLSNIAVFDKNKQLIGQIYTNLTLDTYLPVAKKPLKFNECTVISSGKVSGDRSSTNCSIEFSEGDLSKIVSISAKNYIGKIVALSNSSKEIDIILEKQKSDMHGIFYAFAFPDLHDSNDIRQGLIYLPSNYRETEDFRFPVLYMHDGQSVFTGSNELEVDEFFEHEILSNTTKGIIVVGINSTSNRNFDYVPWEFYDPFSRRTIGGNGDDYLLFIKDNLKKIIDTYYKTNPSSKSTALAGCSLGGLISFYGALKYPETFGISGAFSPSFWCKNMEILNDIELYNQPQLGQKLYFDAGIYEDSMDGMNKRVVSSLSDKGYKNENIYIVSDPSGTHDNISWRRRFPDAAKWMFRDFFY